MAEQLPLRDALQAFAKLNPEQQELLVVAFEKQPPHISLDELASAVARETNVDKAVVAGIANGISGLVQVAVEHPEVGESLSSFFSRNTLGEAAPKSATDALRGYINRFFRCERSIGLTGKAQSIIWGHGNVFQLAHVITQIRPVFFTDLSSDSDVAVIVHELRLDYKVQEQEHNLCIALDSDRIRQFQQVLDRALQKELSLRAKGRFAYLARQKDPS